MMTEEFEAIVEGQLSRCREILCQKAGEYATEDRLHNFRVAAELENTTMRDALSGMMAKHTISLYDMCRSREMYTLDIWNEKVTDHINYLLLLAAVLRDGWESLPEAAEGHERSGGMISPEPKKNGK